MPKQLSLNLSLGKRGGRSGKKVVRMDEYCSLRFLKEHQVDHEKVEDDSNLERT